MTEGTYRGRQRRGYFFLSQNVRFDAYTLLHASSLMLRYDCEAASFVPLLLSICNIKRLSNFITSLNTDNDLPGILNKGNMNDVYLNLFF